MSPNQKRRREIIDRLHQIDREIREARDRLAGRGDAAEEELENREQQLHEEALELLGELSDLGTHEGG